MDKKLLFNEQGHSLFELSISLPIIVMLALSLVGLFCWTLKFFLYEMADWALQEELSNAMKRIVSDARLADSVSIQHQAADYEKYPYCSILLRKPKCFPDTEKHWNYYLANYPLYSSGNHWKLYRSADYEPITGDSIFCDTALLKFHCELIPPARLRIEIKGKTTITQHTVEVKTELFLPEMMKNAAVTGS